MIVQVVLVLLAVVAFLVGAVVGRMGTPRDRGRFIALGLALWAGSVLWTLLVPA